MRQLIAELPYAIRRLAKAPLFTLVCVLTIAIGMGAVTCVYSVVDGVLLKPYPYRNPDRVVKLYLAAEGQEWTGSPTYCLLKWRDHCSAFESVAVLATARGFNLYTPDGGAERVFGARVTGNFFSTLGVDAEIGRTLLPEESALGSARVVVLGNGYWKRRFGSDPGILGQTLVFDNIPREVVGVLKDVPLPEVSIDSHATQQPEIWVPFNDTDFLKPEDLWRSQWDVYARLSRDATQQLAVDQMAAVTEQALKEAEERGQTGEQPTITGHAVPILEYTTRNFQSYLWTIFGTALTVLLIATSNAANLFMARSMEMHRDTTIRSALGASPSSLMRLVILETTLVSLAGGALGALFAYAAMPAVVHLWPNLPRVDQVAIDARVLAATFAIALATGLLCGVAPSLRLRKNDLQSVLKEGGRSASAGKGRNILRNALVIGEVAIALLVVFCAAFFSIWLIKDSQIETGFETDRILTMRFELRDSKGHDEIIRLIETINDGVAALPDIESSAFLLNLPLASYSGISYEVVGVNATEAEAEPGDGRPACQFNGVTSDYFRTLGVPLLSGRLFTPTDTPTSPPVMIVDQRFEDRLFNGGSAIGAQVKLYGALLADTYTIVGVVGHARTFLHDSEDSGDYNDQIYIPLQFAPNPQMYFAVRTTVDDPYRTLPAVRGAIAELYPNQPIYSVESMEDIHSRTLKGLRGLAIPSLAFALVGMSLAALGCYSVMAYRVTQRRHEIGTRMALGATPSRILALIMKQSLVLLASGSVMGTLLVGTTAFVPYLTNNQIKLFQPWEAESWWILGLSLVALTALISISGFLSARKAARIDPLIALRED
jgi:predicted permease